jgi:hypothetical protein
MEAVIDYIVNSYRFKEADYFLYDDNENDIHKLLNETVEKLTVSITTDFKIIETNIYDDNSTISIKFSYKDYLGELYNTRNSRGYDYWCVDFIDVDR